METLIRKLCREVRILRGVCLLLSMAVLSIIFLAWTQQRPGDIIRTRGVVIIDENGRDRILIGAPIPGSNDRIRSDFEKSKDAWGKRYPYFDWYRNLNNGTNGIVILDERGYDKIAIGDPVPDPNIGKRISPSVGLAINDNEGFERTGWGFFPEKNRVALGLDDPRGSEGVILAILEDGSTGISLMSGQDKVYAGSAPPNSPMTELPEPFNGVLIQDSTGIQRKINSFDKE